MIEVAATPANGFGPPTAGSWQLAAQPSAASWQTALELASQTNSPKMRAKWRKKRVRRLKRKRRKMRARSK
ncbi:hypothetical protein LMH87_012224 [Akanthomyces muscarius]|uniref:60S ribosomal protein L41 n=1 Tax=Akanthomyces muscarius TaxID=2231603 RepID=A0A9W8QCY2_AKAMU|nr:hypothetical protein LMH87_012224 [Akanthomyces muscarius]KAJ4151532.1 hypothetical protein LMH87_012224 [Akanthomyces muscarius]